MRPATGRFRRYSRSSCNRCRTASSCRAATRLWPALGGQATQVGLEAVLPVQAAVTSDVLYMARRGQREGEIIELASALSVRLAQPALAHPARPLLGLATSASDGLCSLATSCFMAAWGEWLCACFVNRTQMTQKKLIFADKKDKIRIICENLRASEVSAFYFHSLSARRAPDSNFMPVIGPSGFPPAWADRWVAARSARAGWGAGCR